jgi:hypothetical protein
MMTGTSAPPAVAAEAPPAMAEAPQVVAALRARADEVARHLLDHAVERLRCAAAGPGGAAYAARAGRLLDLPR